MVLTLKLNLHAQSGMLDNYLATTRSLTAVFPVFVPTASQNDADLSIETLLETACHGALPEGF